jgi:8-oxo-dGTP pyrophosphatase MutT (NUDIX family)
VSGNFKPVSFSFPHLRLHLRDRLSPLTDLTSLGDTRAPAGGSRSGLLEAAVLVPVIPGAQGAELLLTLRTDTLKHHPGQISFPGGRRNPGDLSLAHTALRECQEEIGVGSEGVDLLGVLADYETGSGFRITPVVGLIDTPPALKLNRKEVATTLTVPVEFLMDFRRLEIRHAEDAGRLRAFYAYRYEQHCIWGATAAIIVDLCHRLRAVRE